MVSQVHGRWGTAGQVPGIAALDQGGSAHLGSLSCARAGECSAGGQYTDRLGHIQPFVVSQVHGRWGTAGQVPGVAALNQGGFAGISALSCARAGECSAGGFYNDGSRQQQAFVVSQMHGIWGTAIEVPGIAALNQEGVAQIRAVSCAPAGTCSAGGSYTDIADNLQAFVVNKACHQRRPRQRDARPRQRPEQPRHMSRARTAANQPSRPGTRR